jgi:hypothetical protein
MFAGGTAGVALVILRMCAGGALLVCASTHGHLASLSWTSLALGAIVLSLGVGVLTPITCSAGGLFEAYYILHTSGTDYWLAVVALM